MRVSVSRVTRIGPTAAAASFALATMLGGLAHGSIQGIYPGTDPVLDPANTIVNSEDFTFQDILNQDPLGAVAVNKLRVVVFQLASDVGAADDGNDHVRFGFFNIDDGSNIDFALTDIHFDDGTLIGNVGTSISNSVGNVAFNPSSNTTFPQGNELDPPFETTLDFLAAFDPDNPAPNNGVNTGEYLELMFVALKPFQNLILSITNPFEDEVTGELVQLRIGVHVQGFKALDPSLPTDPLSFDTEWSDSLVLTNQILGSPNPDVPEPATLAIWSLLSGGAAAGAALRRRRQTGWSPENRRAIHDLISSRA